VDVKGTPLGRRQLVRSLGGLGLTAGAGGLAVAGLARAASAQQSSTTTAGASTSTATTVAPTTSTAPTTTTTEPPAAPQPSDLAFLAFAQSVELAMVSVYGLALQSGRVREDTAKAMTAFQSHHQDHAHSYAAMGGKVVTNTANQSLVSAFGQRITAAATEQDVIRVLIDLENAAASTYTAALADVVGTDPAHLVGSILPIESRHAVVLGEAIGQPPTVYAPSFESTSGALTPAQYPIVEA
jgi:hypothetical protein